jgi:hypothetical protein
MRHRVMCFTGNRATWPHSYPWGPAQYIYADGGQLVLKISFKNVCSVCSTDSSALFA